ncbi:MFS transporter [Cupriavidus nantongensis]|uniref:MFS transporter n=1 Tax=Cupriavidus nantongensis TaxID=1796606 RepID=UPI00358F74CB
MNHPVGIDTPIDGAAASTPPMGRAIWAASIGTAFEWYEFALYGSLASVLATQFFSAVDSTTAFVFALLTFAIGFMTRPLGALMFGRIGDMIGRKRTFLVTICLMGISTVAVGCLPTYASVGISAPIALILLRICQGLAAGGEYTGALTYVAEYSPARNRGFNMSWTTAATTAGLLMSFLVIYLARQVSGDGFDTWGWRLPFLGSAILLAISLALRLKMEESPAFQRLRRQKALSSSPIRDAFLNRKNFGRIATAFALCAGMTSMYYMAALYPTYFMTQTLKVDGGTVNTLVLLATAASLPFFPISGWLCDRIGRKPSLCIGYIATALLVLPIFHGLERYANPALAAARVDAPVVLQTDLAHCSLMFNPLGNRRFTSPCDTAKQALAGLGVSYQLVDSRNTTVIRVGDASLNGYDAAGLDDTARKQRAEQFSAALVNVLTANGYPVATGSHDINKPMIFALLVIFLACSVLTVMCIGPALVEMFPTRIRYTSMSVPYNLATGWVGGLLPTVVFAISSQTGNIFSGLWYPIGWCVLSVVVLLVCFEETRDVDIHAEI